MANGLLKEHAAIITGLRTKYEKSIKKEETYDKSFYVQQAAMKGVETMETEQTEIPVDCPFESYEDWKDTIKENVKSAQASQNRIEKEKKIVQVFSYFLDVLFPEMIKDEEGVA